MRYKIVWLLFVLLSMTSMYAQKKVVKHPNVIFFSTDDLNSWINPLGHKQAKTPNMDRLAKMGVTFTNAHAPGVYCAPSRTAIWTGLQSTTTGCYRDEVYHYDYPDLVSLQMAFKQAGYNTYGGGKLFHHREGFVDLRGWDEYYARSEKMRKGGYNTGYDDLNELPIPDPYPYSPYYRKTTKKITGGKFLEWAPFPDEMADEMLDVKRTNWACDILKKEHDEPFFLGLGLYTPHYPNYAPQKYFDMYDVDKIEVPQMDENDWEDLPEPVQRRLRGRNKIRETLIDIGALKESIWAYLAAVSYADGMLGKLLDTLEESAYKDNTVIILWSDQGYHLGEKGHWGKHTLWQETSHVPLIFAGHNIPKGKKVDATVGLIDLYPTLMEMCSLPKNHELDGVSLVSSIMKPKAAQDRNLFVPFMEKGSYSVINSEWRYIHYKDDTEELYYLKDDPSESTNLADLKQYDHIKKDLAKAVPNVFREPATPKNKLKLVLDGDKFHWESRDGSVSPQLIWEK